MGFLWPTKDGINQAVEDLKKLGCNLSPTAQGEVHIEETSGFPFGGLTGLAWVNDNNCLPRQ